MKSRLKNLKYIIVIKNLLLREYEDRITLSDIMIKMKEIIKITAKAAKLNANNRKYCFEIFGYDFIIDQEFNVYLLEVNTNPGLEESSPIIKSLVPRMIDDSFRLTIDRVFKMQEHESPFDVEGYTSDENLWEFVVNY